jgi:putative ABC transport system substrate-binding protein
VVFATGDAVGAGLVQSLARPGGNLTGVSALAGEGILSKHLQFAKELVPSASRVGYLGEKGLDTEGARQDGRH